MFRRSLTIVLATWLSFAWGAAAGELVNAKPGGIAIRGYDPVAYFTEGRPVLGVAEHEYLWQGIRWRFSKADHLAQFVGDPRHFAPRYGGFCAGAMAGGWKAPVDPEAFAIVDGKLYLAYSQASIDDFEDEGDPAVQRADSNWDRLGQAD